MSIRGLDHFTGADNTELLSHVPDIGGPWVAWAPDCSDPAECKIGGNVLCNDENIGGDTFFYLGTENLLDGYVQTKFLADAFGNSGVQPFLVARLDVDAFYSFVSLGPIYGSPDQYILSSNLGEDFSIFDMEWIAGSIVRLEVQGTTARAYLDGVLKGTINTSLGAGKWGFQTVQGGV